MYISVEGSWRMFPQEIFASEAIQSKMLDDIAIPKTLQVFYYMFSACDF